LVFRSYAATLKECLILSDADMSVLGQKRTFWEFCAMSALPPKADIGWAHCDVRFVPKADIKLSFEQLVCANK
jgi:hypothetical protein